jgi:pimeloyl-ACP methyl ester carboxylesterase
MGEQNVEEFTAALAGPHELEAYLEPEAEAIRAASADELKDVLVTLLPPVDRDVLTGDRAVHLKASIDGGLAPGIDGWRDDDLAFLRPWGFDLAAIGVPTLLWHGGEDKMVPVEHGRWLAARIPGVEAHLSEPDGHLSIAVSRLGEIYDWLAARP